MNSKHSYGLLSPNRIRRFCFTFLHRDLFRTAASTVVLIILSNTTSAQSVSTQQVVLPVKLIGQETSQWCWAASGQMVMNYHGRNVSQCIQAQNRFGLNGCCHNPAPHSCIRPGWPEFGRYGFRYRLTNNRALSWNELTREIDQKRLVAFSWHWKGGGGHMSVAVGYRMQQGQRFVLKHDPLPVKSGTKQWIPYLEYVNGPRGTGAGHWNDYYEIN